MNNSPRNRCVNDEYSKGHGGDSGRPIEPDVLGDAVSELAMAFDANKDQKHTREQEQPAEHPHKRRIEGLIGEVEKNQPEHQPRRYLEDMKPTPSGEGEDPSSPSLWIYDHY